MRIITNQTLQKISNATFFQQTPISLIKQTQKYDTISFGMTSKELPSIDVQGDYSTTENLHLKQLRIGGSGKLGDVKVDESITIGHDLTASNIDTENAKIGGFARVKSVIKVKDINIGDFLETDAIMAETIKTGSFARIKSKTNVKTIKTGDFLELVGDLNAQAINIGSWAKISGDIKTSELNIEGDLEAYNLEAETVNISGDARLWDIKSDKISVGGDLEVGNIEAKKAIIVGQAKLDGYVKVDSLWGTHNLKINGKSDIQEIMLKVVTNEIDPQFSLDVGNITKLDRICIRNSLAYSREGHFRFNSPIPEKLKIAMFQSVYGSVKSLVIETVEEDILSKLELFQLDMSKPDHLGQKLPEEILRRIVKIVKIK